MTGIFFDSNANDTERRSRLFGGDVFVYSPRPATLALIDFARELIEEAFAPLPPRSTNAGAEQLADRWTTARAAAKIREQLVVF